MVRWAIALCSNPPYIWASITSVSLQRDVRQIRESPQSSQFILVSVPTHLHMQTHKLCYAGFLRKITCLGKFFGWICRDLERLHIQFRSERLEF